MSLSEFSLQGKKALVIGARRNMGKGFALGLAEAGADVAVTDLNTESGQLNAVCEEIKAMNRNSICIKTDISSQPDVKKKEDKVKHQFGRNDIMMNLSLIHI